MEPDRPLVLLLPGVQAWDDATRQALRVGYESIAGFLEGGLAAWQSAGGEVEGGSAMSVRELAVALEGDDPPLVLDVRQADEYATAHVPGALHLMAGDVPDRLAELPRQRPIAAICASGYRASVAASLLRRAGFRQVAWVRGGVPDWQAAGLPVVVS